MDSSRVLATYRINGGIGGEIGSGESAIRGRAMALALEQSVELPLEAVSDVHVLENIVARVADVAPGAGGAHLVKLALSAQTIGDDAGQLMNMLFGNSSLHADAELVDVEIPEDMAQQFGGPRLGIAGLRDLTGVRDRALTCSALKPIGSSPAQLADLCRSFARAGVDLIKDDHGWANQTSAPFEARVRACQEAVADGARDGGATLYLPSLHGHHGQMQQQIDFARALGVRAFLIAPMICGVATFNALARANRDVAFMAHPALAGAARISPSALLGKLFRLFGADATIFPNHGGRFTFTRAACESIATAARSPWHGLYPAFPVPAGGMSLERVPELLRDYGSDTVLLIGGSLLVAREHLFERAQAFVRAVAEPQPVEAAA